MDLLISSIINNNNSRIFIVQTLMDRMNNENILNINAHFVRTQGHKLSPSARTDVS